MKLVRYLAVLAATAAGLVVPTTVSAHPSVYTDVARTNANDADPATLANQTRHVVTNHGFTFVLRETNGLADHGVMDYSLLPSDYRASIPGAQVLEEGDSGAQAHATCQGVAALQTEDAIRSWQEADPFYNYVPFQATSAGLEDDPAHWIPVVQTLTGVDLTTTDPATACAGLSGTYTPADETQTSTASLNSGYANDLTTPLNAQIAELEVDLGLADETIAQLEAQVASANAGGGAQAQSSLAAENKSLKAEVAKLKLEATRLKINSVSGKSAKVSGPAGKSVSIKLTVSKKVAKRLKLKSRTVASGSGKIGANATGTITLKVNGLKKGSVKATATASCEDRVATTAATLKG